jgi:hypothetical protein
MTVVIEDERTVRELERLSRERAISPEEVVRQFVLENAERPPAQIDRAKRRIDREAIREIQKRVAQMPILEDRSPDELLYDEDGLFR